MNDEVWLLDASAFVKLVTNERETEALHEWVAGRNVVSSALLRTEARRAVAGSDILTRRRCEHRLLAMDLVELTPTILDTAGRLPGRALRALDAIYVACALDMGADLDGIVSYDKRQIAAAEMQGLTVVSPGWNSLD